MTRAPSDILAAMRQDKKVERGRLTFILARGIGESFIARDVDEAQRLGFPGARTGGIGLKALERRAHYAPMRAC